MKKYYSYRVVSEDGVLCYVGKHGRNIVSTPITFDFVGAALKVARTLRLKTGKLHDVIPVRKVAKDGDKVKKEMESIPHIDALELAKFNTPKREYPLTTTDTKDTIKT